MASVLDLPRGITPASGMLVRTILSPSTENDFTAEFTDIEWSLSPGLMIGVWGIGGVGPNIQADGNEYVNGISFDPDEAQTATNTLLGKAATVLYYGERFDLNTNGGSLQQDVRRAPVVMLPYPLWTVRNSRAFFANRSAGAAFQMLQVFYQVYEAESARLIEIAGLSLSR